MIFPRSANKIVAVFSLMLLTGCATQNKSNVSMNKSGRPEITKTKIVYVARNIQKGDVIVSKDLEEREIWQSKVPPDAVSDPSLAVGRLAKYDVATGELLSTHDIGDIKAAEVKIVLSKEEHEKLSKKAADNHQTNSELVKSWVVEHLKK